jgi:hypothetical protein
MVAGNRERTGWPSDGGDLWKMAAIDDVDRLIEQYQRVLDEFIKGNPKPVQELFSDREDASLANPYGPPVRGWDGMGPRPPSMPHRYAETAGQVASRS